MSRYVTPASKHASKIGTLKSGSTAFRTASARVSRISATIASLLDASIACAQKRLSSSRLDERGRARGVVVGERAVLEERSALGDLRERRSDASGSDDEYPHGAGFYTNDLGCSVATGGDSAPADFTERRSDMSVSVTQQKSSSAASSSTRPPARRWRC